MTPTVQTWRPWHSAFLVNDTHIIAQTIIATTRERAHVTAQLCALLRCGAA